MKTITFEVPDELLTEYQQQSLNLARWILGGVYQDPSGPEGWRAKTLALVDERCKRDDDGTRLVKPYSRGPEVLRILGEARGLREDIG